MTPKKFKFDFYSNKRNPNDNNGEYRRLFSVITEAGFKRGCAQLGIPTDEANEAWEALKDADPWDGGCEFSTGHGVQISTRNI